FAFTALGWCRFAFSLQGRPTCWTELGGGPHVLATTWTDPHEWCSAFFTELSSLGILKATAWAPHTASLLFQMLRGKENAEVCQSRSTWGTGCGSPLRGARETACARDPTAVGTRPTLEMRPTSTVLVRFARWVSSRVSMLKRSDGTLYPVERVRFRSHSSYRRYTEGNQAHFLLLPELPGADPQVGGVGAGESKLLGSPIRRRHPDGKLAPTNSDCCASLCALALITSIDSLYDALSDLINSLLRFY